MITKMKSHPGMYASSRWEDLVNSRSLALCGNCDHCDDLGLLGKYLNILCSFLARTNWLSFLVSEQKYCKAFRSLCLFYLR